MDSLDARRLWLESAYNAFNSREIDSTLERLDPGVEWPDLLESRTLRGPEAVRAYWLRQFEVISSRVQPAEIAQDETHAAVFADQSVRDLATGREESGRVVHLWTFAGERVSRMEVYGDPDHPRVSDFRRFHERQAAFYAGGEVAPLAELLAPAAEWHVPGRNAIAGTYRGRDEVLEYFARRRELAQRTFTIGVREAFGADPGVVTLAYGSARMDGEQREWGTAGVYRFAGERLVSGRLLTMDQEAFDAIWS